VKAITITKHGGRDVLAVNDVPDPEPGTGEVRIKVEAAGLNFAEVMARQGLYPDAPKPPCVVGYEAAGVVDAVGEGVRDRGVGDRVLALTKFGGHQELVCVPELQAAPMPENMDFETAAAIPVVYLTAYHMLFRVAGLKPGMSILVHMAAGGVGIAVTQLAKTVADVTIYGTASPQKHDLIRAIGCDHPIDYRSLDYAAEVRRMTDGRGVDIVLDPLGGADWRKGYDLLAPAGHLCAFGFANAASGPKRRILPLIKQVIKIPRFNPMKFMNDNRAVSGVNMGHLWDETGLLREELDAVLALYEQDKVHPRIDSRFYFSEAAEAHAQLEQRKNIGKVVLQPDPS